MNLDDWVKNGWLSAHAAVPSEIQELLAVGERDVKDSHSTELSDDWRFGIAYNAVLQFARAALLAEGYQTQKGDSHHFRAIDSLTHTLKIDVQTVDLIQTFRKKRSSSVYEAVGRISAADVSEIRRIAIELQRRVQHHLTDKHPQLLRRPPRKS